MSVERIPPSLPRTGEIKFPFNRKKAWRSFKKIVGPSVLTGKEINTAFKIVKSYCTVSQRLKTAFFAAKAPKLMAAPVALEGLINNISRIVLNIIEMAERGPSRERIFSCIRPTFEFVVNAETITDAVASSMDFLNKVKVIGERAVDWVSTLNVISFVVSFISIGFATKSLYGAQNTYRLLRRSQHELKRANTDAERADILLNFLKEVEGTDPKREKIEELQGTLKSASNDAEQIPILKKLIEELDLPTRKKERIKALCEETDSVTSLISSIFDALEGPDPKAEKIEQLHQEYIRAQNDTKEINATIKLLKAFSLSGLKNKQIRALEKELKSVSDPRQRTERLLALLETLELSEDITAVKEQFRNATTCVERGNSLLALLKAIKGPSKAEALHIQLDRATSPTERAEIMIELFKRFEGPDLKKQRMNALHKKLMLSKKGADLKNRIENVANILKKTPVFGVEGQSMTPDEARTHSEEILSTLKGRAALQLGFNVAELASRVAGAVGSGISLFGPPGVATGFIVMACSGAVALVCVGTKLLFINKNPFDPESRNRINSLLHKATLTFDKMIERLKAVRASESIAHPK